MAWWNPKSWFASAPEPVAAPRHLLPERPFVWVSLRPDHPEMGLDFYADDEVNPFKYALCVKGLTAEEARSELVGKVIDWNRFTADDLAAIEAGNTPLLSHSELKAMYL